MKKYPNNTVNILKFDSLLLQDKQSQVSEYLSTRMIKAANMSSSGEFIGWQMIVPKKGSVEISSFSSKDFTQNDMKWIIENIAIHKVLRNIEKSEIKYEMKELYELYLPIHDSSRTIEVGFGSDVSKDNSSNNPEVEFAKWPTRYANQLNEMIEALREIGGVFRAVVGKASSKEQIECKSNFLKTYNIHQNIDAVDYLGHPVKTKFFVALPSKPSIRFLSVLEEAIPESELRYIGSFSKKAVVNQWDNPLSKAVVLPDYAARIMLMEPIAYNEISGMIVKDKPVKPIAATHKNTKAPNSIVIGKAIETTGKTMDVAIGDFDLKRHVQIIGQTGTGKSTLLTTIVHNALMTGHGCTLFDPHGTTVDNILATVPENLKHKVRVVRIGDVDNPVPLNIWDTSDPEKEERNISDICELFSDIFDPNNLGFVGPRYERWLSTFSKAAIALFGRRASFESIALLSQNTDNMFSLYKHIVNKYPFIASTVRYEYGTDRSNEMVSVINWYVSKLQKLTSVEQLRKTLGAGTNALDFEHTIGTDTVTLIDLASPVIGSNASRIVGTMVMMKLWNAFLTRGQSDKTHIVVVDEASLFQTNPMPKMLAEGRKFGLSMILCHQHTTQLSEGIRDALEANSANFITFRLSAKDAQKAAIRFDDEMFQTKLTRLNAFNAIASLSVDGKQTTPFSLETIKAPKQADGERIAKEIEQESIKKLVDPYRDVKALTKEEIMEVLKNAPELK